MKKNVKADTFYLFNPLRSELNSTARLFRFFSLQFSHFRERSLWVFSSLVFFIAKRINTNHFLLTGEKTVSRYLKIHQKRKKKQTPCIELLFHVSGFSRLVSFLKPKIAFSKNPVYFLFVSRENTGNQYERRWPNTSSLKTHIQYPFNHFNI